MSSIMTGERFHFGHLFRRVSLGFLRERTQERPSQLVHRLFFLLNQEKLYLSPHFSLDSLALRLNVTPSLLSKALRETIEQDFLELINYYRVQEAKKILANPNNIEICLENISSHLGYLSHSNFLKTFYQHTLLTPDEYRQQMNLVCGPLDS
ncbi:helix-turn-helix domain-containing protein [Runella limosa]|uniref:helix-turn-helix domain-containing protein n=1 Tax=Runella limosa TaxID=370978 RepID=UPI0009FDEF27|nr:helix-turn-helix domain-containing protein [Runella limosa]